jgi:hypothetical protein
MACIHGHSGVVKILMKYAAVLNIDLHTKNCFYGWTAFHLACLGGHLDVVKMFMENAATLNINLNRENTNKNTALHLARHLSM